ncbi:MAG: hypothetical protein LBR25_02015 [Erysipelotrichaceae bacterium]|jgi:hypothetical protein|nr:hypothetical protein [Erysipelotrichaceae bacterium]
MSTEWYLQAFEVEDEQQIPTFEILSLFNEYPIKQSQNYVDLSLPDGDVTIFVDVQAESICHLTITRPILSEALYKLIYNIMSTGNFVFYSPGGNYPIILNETVREHLPLDMMQALGEPKVGNTPEAFLELLKNLYA